MRKHFTLPPGNHYIFARNIIDSGNHVLIAGSTGSGKSVLLNDIIFSALQYRFPFKNDSNSINFIWIDPKSVELYNYKDLPHTINYSCKYNDILSALEYAASEVDRRLYKTQGKDRIYQGTPLYIVIDELMDLVNNNDKRYSKLCAGYISHIATKGRAARVVLLMCTQNPNRKTLDASIVGNVNTRIALRCNSDIESRQILPGCSDAVRLPEHGVAIIREGIKTWYQQIPLTTDRLIKNRVNDWVNQKKKSFLGCLFG